MYGVKIVNQPNNKRTKETIMDYNKVLKIWGKELLTERGYTVTDDSEIQVDIITESYGGCETCSYDETMVTISMGQLTAQFDTYFFKDILLKLVEITARNVTS